MKLGILGTGMIVKDLMTTYNKLNVEKTYILGTERFKEETEELVSKYHLDGAFYDYDELLKTDIDTVYVALPNVLHYSFAKKALENGKHVILEKPITSNYKEFLELQGLAESKDLILVEAMNIHYLPAYQSLKEDVKKLGDLKIVSFNYSQYSSRYDAFKAGNVLPAFDPEKSGGALMDINVYNVHAVVGLFGKPLSVKYNANIERNIDTSGMLTLDYGTFKAVCIGAKDCKAPLMSSIQGDKGTVVIYSAPNTMTAYELSENKGATQKKEFESSEHRLYYEFAEFIDMIDRRDLLKAREMLKISGIASELMEKARLQEGIYFKDER